MDEKEFYDGYSVDDEDQPQAFGDALTDNRGLAEPLDEGYSPPERWSAGQGYGTTELEATQGAGLDERLREEEPETAPYAAQDVAGEVGTERAGRLVGDDAGAGPDTEPGLHATDVGIDGAGASAEEAAVHVIADEPEADLFYAVEEATLIAAAEGVGSAAGPRAGGVRS
jgi:hypothetical protein